MVATLPELRLQTPGLDVPVPLPKWNLRHRRNRLRPGGAKRSAGLAEDGLTLANKDRGLYKRAAAAAVCGELTQEEGDATEAHSAMGPAALAVLTGHTSNYHACQCTMSKSQSENIVYSWDVGTKKEELLKDEFNIGLRQRRATGQEYVELLDEFMAAVKQDYGQKALVQFEDFANHNAFTLLKKYRGTHVFFNDNIQGTASVVLACLIAGLKFVGGPLADHRFLLRGSFMLNVGRSQGGASLGHLHSAGAPRADGSCRESMAPPLLCQRWRLPRQTPPVTKTRRWMSSASSAASSITNSQSPRTNIFTSSPWSHILQQWPAAANMGRRSCYPSRNTHSFGVRKDE